MKLILQCSECGEQNYITTKNRQAQQKKLSLRKHCPRCNRHTVHREARLRR
ncbi:MAG: 50S ribosomal protein L33 [Armatimonadetes bacterium]|nr:50S ribosomal protein L33 [Armatimonadota bacterium]